MRKCKDWFLGRRICKGLFPTRRICKDRFPSRRVCEERKEYVIAVLYWGGSARTSSYQDRPAAIDADVFENLFRSRRICKGLFPSGWSLRMVLATNSNGLPLCAGVRGPGAVLAQCARENSCLHCGCARHRALQLKHIHTCASIRTSLHRSHALRQYTDASNAHGQNRLHGQIKFLSQNAPT